MKRIFIGACLMAVCFAPDSAVGAVLVPAGSTWKYLDNGSNQGSLWRGASFNDSGWASGPARLGFGGDGEVTPLAPGAITYYFRKSFTVANPSNFAGVTVHLLRDDGAVVYINGSEAFRSNMPPGTITYTNLATIAVAGAGEQTFFATMLSTNPLVAGTNVIAVEVHQSSTLSSDIGFDLEVFGQEPDEDNDGMPDAWETTYGFQTNNAGDASSDPDGDDMTNLEEYLANTDPLDPVSYLGLSSISLSFGQASLQFVGRAGLRYRVEYKNSLNDTLWTLLTRVTGAGSVVTVSDSNASVASRYYRVSVAHSVGIPPVYSVNMLGFVNVNVPSGLNSFTRPRLATANNGIEYLMPSPPDGTCVYKWNPATGGYDIACYIGGAWEGDSVQILPGESFQIDNPAPPFTLTFLGEVLPAPLITIQPLSQTVPAGSNVTFSVTADGEAPLYYQWVKDGSAIAGATNASYSFATVCGAEDGDYWVTVTNAHGSVESAHATLQVIDDVAAPTVVCAYGTNDASAVFVIYSELVRLAEDPFNYQIRPAGGGDSLAIASASYQIAGATEGITVILTIDPSTPMAPGASYELFVNGPTDRCQNSLDPVVIPISRFNTPLVLIDENHSWAYHDGGVDLGTAWRSAAYDDSSWSTGPAVFDAKRPPRAIVSGQPVRTQTTLSNATATAQIPAHYFRSHFSFSGSTTGVVLQLRPFVDDGAVFYLNGTEILRLRMPAGTVSYATLANRTVSDAVFDGPLTVCVTNLNVGDNVIAAEVHQVTMNSSDLTFGVEISALLAALEAPAITTQPQSQSVALGSNATFTVTATGSELTYQWRKDGVPIPDATNSTLTIVGAQAAHAGNYDVVVSNPIPAAVTSDTVTLTVVGPTIFWIGGSGNWNTASNWNTGTLPGPGDEVLIDSPGEIVVTHSSGTHNVKSIQSREVFVLSGGSLTISDAAAFNPLFNFTAGTLSGSGDVTITGTMNWSGGTMSGSGRTIIANTGTLNMTTTTRNLERVLQNDGAATWTAGPLIMIGGTFNNNGSFVANSDSALESYGNGGTNAFNNAGSFSKQGTGTTRFWLNYTTVSFNNSGTVEVQDGILGLEGGGSHNNDFMVTNAATLRLNGTHTFSGTADMIGGGNLSVIGGTVTDAGMVNLTGAKTFSGGIATFNGAFTGGSFLSINGGTANFNTAVTYPSGTLSSGALSGSGNVTITGVLNWSGGTMSGSGKTIIANTGTLNISNGIHYLERVLQNDGAAAWTGSPLIMVGGTFNNNGSFVANSGSTLDCYGNGGTNAFNNAGTFTKQGTGTTQFWLNYTAVNFNNSGTVDVQQGMLALEASGSHSNDFMLANAATLRLNGTHSFSATADITGSGNVSVIGGTANFNGLFSEATLLNITDGTVNLNGTTSLHSVTLSNGILSGSGDVTIKGTFNWSDGTMSGSGRTIIVPTGMLNITAGNHYLQRVLQNEGAATWTAGPLIMNGGTFNNNASFVANSDATLGSYGNGGINAFNNTGTFIKQGTGTTQFWLNYTAVSFNNSGTVDVQQGMLALEASGSHSNDFMLANGATLRLNGTHSFSATADITGSGNVSVIGGTANFNGLFNDTTSLNVSSGTANVNQTTWLQSCTLAGGIFSGSGDVTITGTFNWSDGTMRGSGRTIIYYTGTLNIHTSTHYLERVLQNDGTATWTAGPLIMNGGTFNNFGSFAANSASGLESYGNSGTNAFINFGTFIKQGTGMARFYVNYTPVSFHNTGSVNVQAGTLQSSTGVMGFPGASVLQSQAGATFHLLSGNLTGSTTNYAQYTPAGRLLLDGGGTRPLEVMARDVGAVASGFIDNFAYGTLELANNIYVRLMDTSDNSPGAAAEALYVNTLVVPAGCTLDLNGFHLYTGAAQTNGSILGGAVTVVPSQLPVITMQPQDLTVLAGDTAQFSVTAEHFTFAVINDIVETGGDNEPTDTVTAKWTGVTFVNGVANEPVIGKAASDSYTVGPFGNHSPAFVDRNHRWTNASATVLLPPYLIGREYIMIGNDNRDNTNLVLDVSVTTPVIVYMLIDNRLGGNNADPPTFGPTNMQWILDEGWLPAVNGINRAANTNWPDEIGIDEGADGTINQWSSIYYKTFPAGTFQLKRADNPGQNMYGVVLAADTAATPLSYQWFFDTTTIAGETNSTLLLSNVQQSDAGNYHVIVSTAHGSVTSAVAVLKVIAVQPGAAGFPIATEAGRQFGVNAAFNGQNYLVAIQGNESTHDRITAQLVSQAGTLVGGRIDIGRDGGLPGVACDGTNFLMVWEEAGPVLDRDIFGQFISGSGGLMGSPFAINADAGTQSLDLGRSVVFDGQNYFIVWTTGGEVSAVYGQFVTVGGELSGEKILISAEGERQQEPALAFAGTNLFAVWQSRRSGDPEQWDIYGRFITRAGTPLTPFLISEAPSASRNPLNIGFDGSNFLVAWNRDIGPGFPNPTVWDIYGRFVSPSGALPGGEFPVTTALGNQRFPSLAFDGLDYLIAWNEGIGTTNSDCKFRFFNRDGVAVGSEFSVFTAQGANLPSFAGLLFDGSKYLVTATLGVVAPGTFEFSSAEVHGAFIYPKAVPPQIVIPAADRTVVLGGNASFTVEVSGSPPYFFQWFFNDTNAVAGATDSTLSLANIQFEQAGNYSVVVSNAAGSVTSLVATLTVLPCLPVPSGLVAWWPGDGNATDVVGTNHGTLSNGASFVAGKVGQAFSFDGSNAFVQVADTPSLRFAGEFTIFAWVRPNQFGPPGRLQPILHKDPQASGDRSYYFGLIPAGTLQLGVFGTGADSSLAARLSDASLATGEWHHVTGVYRGGVSPALDVYINGQLHNGSLIQSAGFIPSSIHTNAHPVFIGAYVAGIHPFPSTVDGLIDEVSVFDRALSSNEIAAIYAAGSSGMCPIVPTITGVSSLSGAIGSSITITGANFSGVLFNNIVYFGAVRANVVSGTTSNLVVTVPVGATYGPISITVDGRTATSHTSFIPTFESSGFVGPGSFGDPIQVAGSSAANALAVGDLDRDGRPDLVASRASGPAAVTVYRNQSTPGILSGASFASAEIPAGGFPVAVAVADIDGDGSLDVIADHVTQTTIAVLRNMSTPGVLSFASPALFTKQGSGCLSIATGDLDNDGRIDVVVGNYDLDTLSVLRNTSSPGAVSFAAAMHVTVGLRPNNISISDLDGDGRGDVIVSIESVDATAILRNTSLPGIIGFAPAVALSSQAGHLSAAVADFNGDARPDLLRDDYGDDHNIVSVAENFSSPGSIQFGPAFSFGVGLFPRSISAADLNGDGALDISTANEGTNTVSILRGIGNLSQIASNSFAPAAHFFAGTGPFILAIADFDGDAKPDIAVSRFEGVFLLQNMISCQPPPSGIVSWWRGEGNALDAVGGNHGVLSNGTTFTAGKVAQAFGFDGADDFVIVPASPTLNVGGGNGFTLEAWVNLPDVSPGRPVIEWKGPPYYGVHFWISPGGRPGALFANITDTSGGWHFVESAPGLVTLNVFHHIALTYDKISGAAELFLNGAVVASSALGSFTPETREDMVIGRRVVPVINSFAGIIDEVALYNRALLPNEIAAIYTAGSSGKCKTQMLELAVQGAGVIAANPAGPTYLLGDTVSLTALPNVSAVFSHWTDGVTSNPRDVIIRLSNSYTAVFTNTPMPLILVNGRPPAEGSATTTNMAIIEIQSPFSGGSIYFTVDGGDPHYGYVYTGPFAIHGSAVVRAVAYTAGFSNSSEADSVTVTVRRTPVIVSQPQSQVAAAGSTVVLAVEAAGDAPFEYQWLKDGLPIAGGTSATLTLSSIMPAHAGSYAVVVSNPYGSVTSSAAMLSVVVPPGFSGQPASTNVSRGQSARFCVMATGDPTLLYQWRKNGANMPGQTNSCLDIPNVQIADGGFYDVVVQNEVGVAASQIAELTISDVQVFPGGDDFAARVALEGAGDCVSGTNINAREEFGEPNHAGKACSNSVWYSWVAPFNGIATFETAGSSFDTLLAVYTGSNFAQFVQVAADEDSAGFFNSRVRFSAVANTQYQIAIDGYNGQQGTFVLCWNLQPAASPLPFIVDQPDSLTVRMGQPATFSVMATSATPVITYQWFFNYGPLDGETNPVLNVASVLPVNVGFYYVGVSNESGGILSDTAVLEIGPVSTIQSVDKLPDLAAPPPSPAPGPGLHALQVAAAATGTPISVGAGTLDTQVINNTGSATSSREPAPCRVLGGASRWLWLQVEDAGTVRVDTIGSTIDTVLGILSGPTPLDAVPFRCDDNGAPDGLRSMVTFEAEAGGSYYIQADGKSGTNGIIFINWGLGSAPASAQPVTTYLARQGATIPLVCTAAGVPAPTFQWRRNGSPLVNQTSSSLTLANIQPEHAGEYSVVISNFFAAITNEIAVITVDSSEFLVAQSSFDTGVSGWGISGDAINVTHRIANGNPGAHVSAEDGDQGGSWYWVAPASHLGNKFHCYDGYLTFDLRQSVDVAQQLSQQDVIMEGARIRLVLDRPNNPGTSWTTYRVLLSDSGGWVRHHTNGSLTLATRGEIVAVLTSLTNLLIRADFSSIRARADIDNILFLAPTTPSLSLRRAESGDWLIEWPWALDGYSVQRATTLTAPDWQSLAIEPVLTNHLKQIRVGPELPQQFFRLQK